MPEEIGAVQKTYNALADKYDLGDETPESFRIKMAKPASRTQVYESLSVHYDMEDINTFDQALAKDLEPAHVGAWESFTNAAYRGISGQVPGVSASWNAAVGDFDEAREITNLANEEYPVAELGWTPEGIAGFLGSVSGSVGPLLAATILPGRVLTVPAILANYGIQAMGDGRMSMENVKEETGKSINQLTREFGQEVAGDTGERVGGVIGNEALIALGYGTVVFLAERMSFGAMSKAVEKLSSKALLEIGKSVGKKNPALTARIIATEMAKIAPTTGGIEALEEGAEELMVSGLDAIYNPDARTAQAMFGGVPLAMAGGFVGGAMLGGGLLAATNRTQAKIEADAHLMAGESTDAELRETQIYADRKKEYINSLPTEAKTALEQALKVSPKAANEVIDENIIEAVRKNVKSEAIISNREEMRVQMENDNSLAARALGYVTRLGDWLDVETPFKRLKAPLTGLAVKLLYPRIAAGDNASAAFIKSVFKSYGKQGLNEADVLKLMNDLPFLYENKVKWNFLTKEQKAIHQEAYDLLDGFFKGHLETYIKKGGFKKGFIETRLEYLNEKLRLMEQNLASRSAKGESTKNFTSALIKLRAEIKRTKNTNFVHIPSTLWIDHARTSSKLNAEQKEQLRILGAKKRNLLRLDDIISGGETGISREDIKFWDIIAHYSRQAAKDEAMLTMFQAAEKENLAIKGIPTRKGLKTKHPFNLPKDPTDNKAIYQQFGDSGIGSEYFVHPLIKDFLTQMKDRGEKTSGFGRFMNLTKMGQFINPIFLPMYDVVQGVMAGAIAIHHPIRTVKYLRQGINDFVNKTPEWFDAEYNGRSSTPYPNPIRDAFQMAEAAASMHGQPGILMGDFFRAVTQTIGGVSTLRLPSAGKGLVNMLKATYNMSWTAAWTMDGIVRQVTYRYALDKGMSSMDAAQYAARYHGDYAGVPADTRRALNKIFFTPTFKIAMGKLYTNMIRAHGEQILPRVRTPEDAKHNDLGLMRTFAMVAGMDALMLALGWERDQFGRRYLKRTTLDETGPVDTVLTWSAPMNMFLKYLYRALDAFGPEVNNSFQKLMKSNIWEIHPVSRVAIELGSNKTARGEPIWSAFDSSMIYGGMPVKELKAAAYLAANLVPILKLVPVSGIEGVEDPLAREALANEIGTIAEGIRRMFMFTYVRQPIEVQVMYKKNGMLKLFNEDLNRLTEAATKKGVPLSNEKVQELSDNYVLRVQKMIANILEGRYEYPEATDMLSTDPEEPITNRDVPNP